MPPESSPCDRKDFTRERKNEDAATAAGKWKDPFQKPEDVIPTRVSRSDDALRARVLSRQRNSRLFPEESGCSGNSRPATDPRSNDRMVEVVNFRPSSSHRSDGKISRIVRDKSSDTGSSKGFQREWKGYQSDCGDAHLDSPTGRPMDSGLDRSHHHRSHSAAGSSFYGHHIEKQPDKMGPDGLQSRYSERAMDAGTDRPYGTQSGCSLENALGTIRWKPLKWARSSSISSLRSVVSYSSRRKSGKSEVEDGPEVAGKMTPLHVPLGGLDTVDTPVDSVYNSLARKKQRLGWGQGLAKYEKEKVEGHEDACGKNYLSLQDTDLKRIDSPLLGVAENDPVMPIMPIMATCGSPTVASLGVFSLSPDVKDKDSLIHVNYTDDFYSMGPTRSVFAAEDFAKNLDSLDINVVDNLIADLMHNEDSFADSSSFPGSTSVYQLNSLKKHIMKLLEKKEGEIDQSENELRALCSEPEDIIACETLISPGESAVEVTGQIINDFETLPGSTPLVVSPRPSSSMLDSSITRSAVPFDVQFHQEDRSVGQHQACDVQLAASSNADINLVKIADHGESLNKPLCMDKGSDTVTTDQKRNTLVMGLNNKNEFTFSYLTNLMLYVDIDDTLISSIVGLNKKLAREGAAEIFKYVPVATNALQEHPTGSEDSALPAVGTSADVQAAFLRRKRSIKFKEKPLVLKFRALHHLWKEDVTLLCVRKHQTRQKKRLESSSRTFKNGSPKHCSSIRSRFTLTGNLTLVPTKEVVSFTGKLLSHSLAKFRRYNLKMPSMLLDESERKFSRFLSWNGLIEDPFNVEKEKTMINPWTTEEIDIFMEYFATHGKDFSKIASHLQHKTTADCVEYYYKNRKSDVFEEIKKAREKSKGSMATTPTAYLVTGGNNWNREGPSSLDVLGEASVAASRVHEDQNDRVSYMDCFSTEVSSETGDGTPESIVDIRTVGNNKDARADAVDMIPGVCGALSPEAMSSCVTSSIDPGHGCNEWKYLKMDQCDIEMPFTPDTLQNIDEDTCSDESSGGVAFSDWTDAEKAIFITALRSYGKDFATISRCVGSRSMDQCKIFFSKARKCLALDVIDMVSGNEGTPVSDAHGGHSDTEGACATDTDPAFCTMGNSSKMETDSSLGFGSLVSSNDDYGCPGSNSLHLKESVAADRETKLTTLGKEILLKNEDCPADSLVPISSLDHFGALVNAEKVEGNDPALDPGEGSLPDDVSNQKHGHCDPDARAKGPNPHLLSRHVGKTCEPREGLNHAYDRVSAEPTHDSLDSDACSPGLLGGSHDKQKPQFALRKSSLKQIIEGVSSEEHDSSISVVCPSAEGGGICAEQPYSSASKVVSGVKGGGLCSEQHDSSASVVVPYTRGSVYDVALPQQVDLDNPNNCPLNRLEVKENSMIPVVESSAAVTCSVTSYNSLLSHMPMVSTKVLAYDKDLPASCQRENCQRENCQLTATNSSRGIERGNVINASNSIHRDATSTQAAQMASSIRINAGDNQVHGSETVKRSSTRSDSYRQYSLAGQHSTKVDPHGQTFKGFLLQAADGGSGNSVFEKQQSHHSTGGAKKLHDLRNHLKMQGSFFLQNGDMHHNTHLDCSLFLPRMDSIGSSGEPIPASLFESLCGSTKQNFKKQPENHPELAKRGEVKLFGQSLVVHPPSCKIDINDHTLEKQHPLQERNSSAATGLNLANRKISTTESPRTYGYWDGNRTQTGFQALPDSGFLVSSGSRVSDCGTDSCNRTVDLRLQVDDPMFYRSGEGGGASRITNYHIYSSDPVQPFSPPLNVVSETPTGNMVMDKMPQAMMGLLNQGLGASTMSSVNCVSDPVVALKMQFAENFCRQKGVVREEDPWRGDINR